jgi:hypothetical protein
VLQQKYLMIGVSLAVVLYHRHQLLPYASRHANLPDMAIQLQPSYTYFSICIEAFTLSLARYVWQRLAIGLLGLAMPSSPHLSLS